MTSKRKPGWVKKGYQSEAEYRAACSANRKTRRAALAATKAKYLEARILEKMWDQADFDKPIVTITKEQLMALCGCSLWTVKRALSELRKEGSVKPMKGWEGGRAKPTTWRLCVPGAESSPSDENTQQMEAKRDREAAWRFLSGKYGPAKALEILGSTPDE